MKSRHLLLPLVVGLAFLLIVTLQWTVGDLAASVVAAPPAQVPNAPNAELHVCLDGPPTCDYAHIQDAVDAAAPDTVIKVAKGVYTDIHARDSVKQVVYIDRSLTVRGGYDPSDWSTSDPELNPTIVDARRQGRGFYLTGTITVTIEALDITGGDATGLGGGALSYDGTGGGLYAEKARLNLYVSKVYDNIASRNGYSAGGGLFLYKSHAGLMGNTIISNTAGTAAVPGLDGEGGGLALSASSPVLVDNTIRENVASSAGQGLGGGIYMEGCYPYLYRNIIQYNSASLADYGQGGGIYEIYCDARLYNTVFIGNFSGPSESSWGSAYAIERSSPVLEYTTLHDNSGPYGNAIFVYYGGDSEPVLHNTILVSQMVGISVTANSTATVNGILWSGNEANTGGPGTFIVTNEYTGSPSFTSDGYHLQPGSAAIDKGVISWLGGDIDHQSRPYGSAPDLGVDEWYGEVELRPGEGGTFTYTDSQGLPVVVEVPPGAIVQTTTLAFAPLTTTTYPFPPDLCYGGSAFNLDAYCLKGEKHAVYLPFVSRGYSASLTTTVSSLSFSTVVRALSPPEPTTCSSEQEPCPLAFQRPVTITVYYSDAITCEEDSLRLYYWTGSEWQDAANTCTPTSTYVRNTTEDWLSVAICHLSQFSIGGR